MLKIVEIKETIINSDLQQNILEINNLLKELGFELQFLLEINKDDYNYINIIIEKCKKNLEKALLIVKN